MKNLTVLISLVFSFYFADAQERFSFNLPDFGNYQLLACDLHMHTVFSDGQVWPTVRVDEAWLDGLDAISITDHLEYQAHKEYVKRDPEAPYEITKEKANSLNILNIKGAEITRDYHYNVIFTKENDAINKETTMESIEEAYNQGAYIFWNHPGWRKENEIPIWEDEQEEAYNKGYMMGIEIVNGSSYYPLAHQWAIDKGLTLIGNTDIHTPITVYHDYSQEAHRTTTYALVTERSPEGFRQALDNGRTFIHWQDKLIGDEAYLKPLFEACVEVEKFTCALAPGMPGSLVLKNNSGIDIVLVLDEENNSNTAFSFSKRVEIPANKSSRIVFTPKEKTSGDFDISVPYIVENFWTTPETGMPTELSFKVIYK